jgi:hypothetical protein
MARTYHTISDATAGWIERQQMFFVATAPLAEDGHVNLSPKGLDTLRLLDDRTVAYLDLTGSGAETAAHLRENGRITIMWCAFDGPPRIVRVQGRGEYVALDDERVAGRFPELPGGRGVVVVHADRISDSCGYAVPVFEYQAQRDRLVDWADAKSPDELDDYRRTKNATSIDGLPAIDVVAVP